MLLWFLKWVLSYYADYIRGFNYARTMIIYHHASNSTFWTYHHLQFALVANYKRQQTKVQYLQYIANVGEQTNSCSPMNKNVWCRINLILQLCGRDNLQIGIFFIHTYCSKQTHMNWILLTYIQPLRNDLCFFPNIIDCIHINKSLLLIQMPIQMSINNSYVCSILTYRFTPFATHVFCGWAKMKDRLRPYMFVTSQMYCSSFYEIWI